MSKTKKKPKLEIILAKLHFQTLKSSLFSKIGLSACLKFYKMITHSKNFLVLTEQNRKKEITGAAVILVYPINTFFKIRLCFFIFLLKPIRLAKFFFSFTRDYKAPKIPEILFLFVAPKFQNRGIGTRLLLASHHELIKKKYKKSYVWTETGRKKTALQFYLNNGYQPLKGNEKKYQSVLLQKKLLE